MVACGHSRPTPLALLHIPLTVLDTWNDTAGASWFGLVVGGNLAAVRLNNMGSADQRVLITLTTVSALKEGAQTVEAVWYPQVSGTSYIGGDRTAVLTVIAYPNIV
jgi:hypothetical protein